MGDRRRSRRETGATSAPATKGAGGAEASLRPAIRSARAVAVFAALVVLGTGVDLVSKHLVFTALSESATLSVEVIGDFLRLTLSTNPGIVFGIEVPGWLVLLATLAAVVVVLVLFATSSARSWGLHVALALVLAGSLGNAHDRLFSRVWLPGETAARTGEVRDFLDVNLYFMRWPAFNVADALLVVGVAVIVVQMVRERPRG